MKSILNGIKTKNNVDSGLGRLYNEMENAYMDDYYKLTT
jgi:hypothetical protein